MLGDIKMPLTLTLVHSNASLYCEQILRHLPGKRLTVKARWNDQTVIAKFFLSRYANKHKAKELKGHQLLKNSKLLVAPLLYEGSDKQNKVSVIIFQYLEKTVDSREVWNTSQTDCRLAFFKKLIHILAVSHDNGLTLSDLHPSNFLLNHNGVYVLDTARVHRQVIGQPVSKQIGLRNLAELFAQISVIYDDDVTGLLDYYLTLRKLVPSNNDLRLLLQHRNNGRAKREKKYLEKIFRNCTHYVFYQNLKSTVACDSSYYTPAMQALINNIDDHIKKSRLLKAGNSNTVSAVSVDDRKLVVKRYNLKNIIQCFKRWFTPNKAVKSWKYAQRLYFYHIPAVKPVALYERKLGPFRQRVYFISEKIDGITLKERILCQPIADHEIYDIATQVKNIMTALQRLKISHGDLKATNFIFSNGRIYLSDFDAMTKHYFSACLKRALACDKQRFLQNWHNQRVVNIFKKVLFEQEV